MGAVRQSKWCRRLVLHTIFVVAMAMLGVGNGAAGIVINDAFQFTHATYNATIYEKAPGKTYVTSSKKMGIYSMLTTDVRYKIFDGDRRSLFKAEENRVGDFHFLRVRTHSSSHGVLNREFEDRYHLKIKAIGQTNSGSSLTATTDLIITVLDRNDLSPLFDPEIYNKSVSEDTPLHSSIVQVFAVDSDIGINKEIYYSFRKRTRTFAIHPTTGVITLTRPLNVFEQNEYHLDVIAEDRGPKHRDLKPKNCTVNIEVLEANFYAPQIIVQHLPAVVENSSRGTIYAIITVTDEDQGDKGVISDVSIIDSENVDQSLFEIEETSNPNEFNLVVLKSLDKEIAPDGYDLEIEATDSGIPPKSMRTTIHVDILDINDNKPLFEKDQYEASVEELFPIGTSVLYLKAMDKDFGRNSEIAYAIESGNNNKLFTIHRDTGLISTGARLDTETVPVVTLLVSAVDHGNRGSTRKGNTVVNITITDCNDNAPVFNLTHTVIPMEENLPIGTRVATITATDADQGGNGRVSYSIANINSVPFEIDHFTGAIKTTARMDFETMRRSYKVKVRASDWGTPFRRESEVTLDIQLTNVNDNVPRFEKVQCSGYLSREAPIGTEIAVITAIDFDSDILSYRIESGNEDGCFDIVPATGTLLLNCSMEDEPESERRVTVIATDGSFVSEESSIQITLVNNRQNSQLSNSDANIRCQSTNVSHELAKQVQIMRENNQPLADETISQLNVNPNIYDPTFSSTQVTILDISEGVAVGTSILSIQADDADPGFNGRLNFVILDGDPHNQFDIGPNTGQLIVISKLDREFIPKYDLEIMAIDQADEGSQRSSTIIISVNLLDENDNPPIFESENNENNGNNDVNIYENILVNATISQLIAHDRDLGVNGKVTYSLGTNINKFSIDPDSGIVRVAQPLDREEMAVYYLPVVASDKGEKPLSSTATLTITLDDVNDEVPKFIPDHYDLKIREDLPVGTVVTIVKAEDPDQGDNGKVTYRLTYGTEDKFEIDELTGVIRIMDSLDFESQQIYNISAVAEDGGGLVSACFINIEVIDVNENLEPPVFASYCETGFVQENRPVGVYVLQVSASDADSETDPRNFLTYSIRDGSGLGRFTIDNNGTIRTSQILDRETAPHYWLTVYAQEHAPVPQHARLEVFIKVIEVNDNNPQFLLPINYMAIMENSPGGLVVGNVSAYDKDNNPTERLTYSITKGNTGQYFSINVTTGVISTTGNTLDREVQETHTLEVSVSDNGTPSLSSVTRVIVKVLDKNDNKPKFLQRNYKVNIMAKSPGSKPMPVLRVFGDDKDTGKNAEITYKIRGKEQTEFTINATTGMIYAVEALEPQMYELKIRATDNGDVKKRSKVRAQIMVGARLMSSMNPPRFDQSVYQFEPVSESCKLGQMLGLVTARDPDKDRIWFSIIAGDDNSDFLISPVDGSIHLARYLDRETKEIYNLTVAATDGVYEARANVVLRVLDSNDNTPMFTQSEFSANVSENAAIGTTVLKISATDRDKNSRLFYTILATGNSITENKFEINSETGEIRVNQELDREVQSDHQLTVMVRDQGKRSHRNYTYVTIHVLDHNDFAPEFLEEVVEGRVFETAAIGTSVVEVMAIDKDKGQNAELSFSITSGNIGWMFDIDETLGIITVGQELNRDEMSSYQLTVTATDHGTPPLSSTVSVNILVTISNNAAPKFVSPMFMAEVRENCPRGTHVVPVEAVCQSSMLFEIVSGNEEEVFSINPNSGIIYTKDDVDYETSDHYNLTVSATNIVGATSTVRVVILVLDLNDNPPVFDETMCEGKISESAPVGSVILSMKLEPLVVHATDLDSYKNAHVTYKITDPKGSKYFSVDSATGAIKTMAALDHEEFDKIEFYVYVWDKGYPQLQAVEPAKVVIHILDMNDNPPYFTQLSYHADILLPTTENVQVIKLNATDIDSVNAGTLIYSIVHGNDDKKFKINPQTGQIFVKNKADLQDSYELGVEVTDGLFKSATTMTISITAPEEGVFVFSKPVYSVNITENTPGPQTLTVIQVLEPMNQHLVFTLLNHQDLFSVIQTSGVLQTQESSFDREENTMYTLVVSVRGETGQVAHVLVEVNILDENDNDPQFVNQPYDTVVALGLQTGELVRQVTAIDRDSNSNGLVRFSVVNGYEDKFDIGTNDGRITLTNLLDQADQNKDFVLTIRASDEGVPPRSVDVNVTISVISDAHPRFEQQFYTTTVREDVQLQTPVISVRAVSPNGHKLIYTIISGDTYKDFDVDFNIGTDALGPCVVAVVSPLDYEVTKGYELVVQAADVKTSATATATIRVIVTDVNDNVPVFTNYKYTALLSEAVGVGMSVVKVHADDKDLGSSGLVYYSIEPLTEGSTDPDFFTIDSQTGLVTLIQPLDHEVQTDFTFVVRATDGGLPASSSTVYVHVIVEDFNDNAPQFDQPSYDCSITVQTTGQIVTRVTASDPDISSQGNLMYAIVGGNDDQTFHMNAQTGLVTLTGRNGDDYYHAYTINVSVSDGVFTSFTRVGITIQDGNKHTPVFQEQPYHASVYENLGPGTLVTTVSANDGDHGNNGLLTYTIISEYMMQFFSIDADTGEIYTEHMFDREVEDTYLVPVAAIDNGGRMGFTMVEISIDDKNDNIPAFTAQDYRAVESYDAAINTTIIQVTARDRDLGDNGRIVYQLYDDNVAQYVSVDPNTGDVRVKADLTPKMHSVMQFFISAVDFGEIPLENNVPVEIYIMGPDEVPPRFPQSKYIFVAPENTDKFNFIRTITAESQQPVHYRVVPGSNPETNHPQLFTVDDSGNIHLNGDLDAEAISQYTLTMLAYTDSSPPLVSHTEVYFQITGINDNDPQFESNPYTASLVENSKPGVKVIQVRAFDLDKPETLTYRFSDGQEDVAQLFNIDQHTAWITLLSSVDREVNSSYNLSVTVEDTEGSVTRTSVTLVLIDVKDYNDNPPVFQSRHYHTAVNELAEPGTVLRSLHVSDADSELNTRISYFIIDGDPHGRFQVYHTGEVCVSRPLDREKVSTYNLQIAATDGGLSSVTTVTIEIIDDNDNSPVCGQPYHEVVLSEDVLRSDIITRVHATDADDASTSNAKVRYLLQREEDREKFTVDETTGILTIRDSLDREEVSKYDVVVSAVDGGQRSCDTQVFIQLSDVNDNRPEFVDAPSDFLLSESAEVNTLLIRVRAQDADLGINRQVKYRLTDDANGTFAVDSETGILMLKKRVDREMIPSYRLVLEGSDQGTPSLSSETVLRVLLQDENDNPPEFVRNSYSETLEENVKPGTWLTQVEATSKDIGQNAVMTYSIVAGNRQEKFSLNPDTGSLYVLGELDYEITHQYILTIVARDRGVVPLSSTAYVTINVTDVNDNTPAFTQASYSVRVNESEKVSSIVVRVSASDADSPPNSVLTYSISDGDRLDNFEINPKDGTIRIKTPLDRESLSRIVLMVKAMDGGEPSLTAEASVQVDIVDANDCPPRFSEDNYTAIVQRPPPGLEDIHIGYDIIGFLVTDDDLHPNGEPFTYDIINGNEGGEFRVDSQGVLTTASKFNHNIKSLYQLVLRVFDNGYPSLYTDVPVTITVTEKGSHPPQVANLEITINSYLDTFPGGLIGRLEATDMDRFDILTYEIISQNRHLFDIDRDDGRLVAYEGLDAGDYLVNISVTDGHYVSYGRVYIDVVAITEKMLNNAVTIQLQNLTPRDFIQHYQNDFRKLVRKRLGIKKRDVQIINVQSSQGTEGLKRKRRNAGSDLDVLFAARRGPNSYYSSKLLRKKIMQISGEIEQTLGVTVIDVYDDICHSDLCPDGKCVGELVFDKKSQTPIVMDVGTFVTTRHSYTHKCVCTDQSRGPTCESPRVGSQCLPGQPCITESTEPEICTDFSCYSGNKPMTFTGQSYAKWTLQDAFSIEQRLSLSLRIKTRRSTANIMFAKGNVDYSILEIFNGMVQYQFDCGSGRGLVQIPVHVNDGKWHTISLERRGRMAEVSLDGEFSNMDIAPGVNDYINLNTKDVYFGAEVISQGFRHTVQRGFEGCMEDVKLWSVRLPFEGSNAVVASQEFKQVQFHCKDSSTGIEGTNICSTFPCMNGGTCQNSGINSYICVCPDRFYGAKCEIDSDPCANSPCRNNAKCQNIKDMPNEFECSCPGDLKGKLCEYGQHCIPNPCQHGGTCVEGPNRAICICQTGFEGPLCTTRVNPCRNNPCLHGGMCHSIEATYICNCTSTRNGDHCQNIIVPDINSNAAGITQETLFGIVGVAVALILLAFLFVLIQCYRRRKNRRRGHGNRHNSEERDMMLRGMKDDKKCKVSSFDLPSLHMQNIPPSPRPPPVPNRPVSYTPSNHADSLNTLNNFDTVRNYGSAADDLEHCHNNIPYQDHYFQTFAPPPPRSTASMAPSLPPPPPSNPPSDTDSIQKVPWENEFPNMLENHEEKKHPEKFSGIPRYAHPMGPDATSFSSLPVSESEDEPARRKKNKDYHWDASDWAPRPSLPNISEVPMKEVPDSPRSSPHSNDSNTHVSNFVQPPPCMTESGGMYTDPELLESEYVGDSEYAENEYDTDDHGYPSPPDYHQILGLPPFPEIDEQGGGQEDPYQLPQHNLHMHPDQYLPNHSFTQSREQVGETGNDPPTYPEVEISDVSDTEDNESVVQYGFPSSSMGRRPRAQESEYNPDYGQSAASMIDNMSVSVGGYTSTNASCSDISGLCEIEDSEVNLSEEDSADELTPLNNEQLHTVV
ncbi:protocadherin Fat 1-like isoform X2 [Argopecten irradians]|uniref:protocadherin Fat 1-like isoform X2 n=1 Tax=Argopecten irradians TaxID=31199 RepID=UPI003719016F